MFIRLFLLFTIVPLVELAILIKIGSIFGVWHTVFVVIITGVIGAYLARNQGIRVMAELNTTFARGQMPTDPLIEGGLVLLSAAFLVTPGVLTDGAGFILVIPQTRKIVRDWLKKYWSRKMKESASTSGAAWTTYTYTSFPPGRKPENKKEDDDDIIDV
ncbi:hypothetical protein MNBD_NITROSPINAE02-758 [hydrothermal vent metagenome]|uniref:Uncharacterized protein n=1 Tax=hydrothermal vent metagenome TaxID=652676 RepID=A0A3B1C5K2_9ZZZZ